MPRYGTLWGLYSISIRMADNFSTIIAIFLAMEVANNPHWLPLLTLALPLSERNKFIVCLNGVFKMKIVIFADILKFQSTKYFVCILNTKMLRFLDILIKWVIHLSKIIPPIGWNLK